ncbi:hypothetical protein SLEP1_g50825 [Rubroshorea leprosula]|uniref:Uncharacterized protein n=1 Tax=Rubroshorea leprosula TaxID=152421 RepID=A0AAV5M2N3_9ROSI|nr:hypothetical protein SLEP1_g50825 [Rubroshorea leprosula]
MASNGIDSPLTELVLKFGKPTSLEEANTDSLPSNKPYIREVPHKLRSCYNKEDCKRYFQPTSVAIGPLNHQREPNEHKRIHRGEECKLKLAKTFIEECDGKVEHFYENVMKGIKSLKDCYYFKGQNWTDQELASMFVVDGCALLLFIVLYVDDKWEGFRVTHDLVGIPVVDFFLLENQLPYQLLKILIESYVEASKDIDFKRLFNEYITDFINKSFLSLIAAHQHRIQIDHSHEQQEEEDPVHLLDLLRRRLMGVKSKKKGAKEQERTKESGSLHTVRRILMGVKSKKKGAENQEQTNKSGWLKKEMKGDKSRLSFSIRNVKELKDNGIRFEAREKVDSLTKIKFNDRRCMPTLKLAPIFLHNTTMPLLMNLLAYELWPYFKEDCKIISYLSFLDSLIDNSEDVKELRDAGVLHHGLGSDEAVAKLFNKISRILVPNLKMDSDFRRIHEYCSNKSHPRNICASFVVKLTDTYFSSPWSFFIFLGALAGLIMTGIQTYTSFQG